MGRGGGGGGALSVANGEGWSKTGAFGDENGLACVSRNTAAAAAAIVDFEDHLAFHDAYPLVVMQGEPRFRGRRWQHELHTAECYIAAPSPIPETFTTAIDNLSSPVPTLPAYLKTQRRLRGWQRLLCAGQGGAGVRRGVLVDVKRRCFDDTDSAAERWENYKMN
jgi:hypothetical protein